MSTLEIPLQGKCHVMLFFMGEQMSGRVFVRTPLDPLADPIAKLMFKTTENKLIDLKGNITYYDEVRRDFYGDCTTALIFNANCNEVSREGSKPLR